MFVSAPAAHSSKAELSAPTAVSTTVASTGNSGEVGISHQELEAIDDRSKLDDYGVYQLLSEQNNN